MDPVAKTRIDDYRAQLADRIVRFNEYTVKKTGLVQSQTILKIEDYVLVCAPFQLSMDRAIFLVILSRQETSFFQRMLKKICSVSFVFTRQGQNSPIHFFIRGLVNRISPVKGKSNVCIIDVTYKVCPDDLVEIIGNYVMVYESLQKLFVDFKGKEVMMSSGTKKLMKFNDFVESQIGSSRVKTKLISMSVDKLVLGIPEAVTDLQPQQKVVSKLYFQSYQFTVNGTVAKVEGPQNGYRTIHYAVDFSPELVEIMDNYFFIASLKKQQ